MLIRVLIVDDRRIVREGLIAMFEDEAEFEVVGEAADGAEATRLYVALDPDVVLMDLQMPTMDGLEATRYICSVDPDARVLILTAEVSYDLISRARRAGAQGYLPKDVSGQDLFGAIRAVLPAGSACS